MSSSLLVNTMFNTMDDAKKIPMSLSPFLNFDSHLLEGWGSDFIIAGEFIHDVLSNCKKRYLDFYIFNEAGFNTLLDFYPSRLGRKYTIKAHYIEISSEDYDYSVRLMNAFGSTPIDIMNGMEVEMLCCYYDGENIYQFPGCEDAIETWSVTNTPNANKCCVSTIIRAIEKGYKISREILEALQIECPDGEDKPHIQTCSGLSPGECEDVMDHYEDELYDYMHVAIKPTNEDLNYLYDCEIQQHFQMQGITVYHVNLAKSFLPYIYQHPIKNQITRGSNINCGCCDNMAVDIEEIVETLHATHLQEKYELEERPPVPSRPPPVLTPSPIPEPDTETETNAEQ